MNGVTFQTDPIPYNASAEQLRQIIQNAIAAGETNDPFLRAYLVDKLDVTVDRYPSGYLAQNIYVLHFQGELRRESFGPGLDTVTIDSSSLTGGTGAWLTTRMDGIQYYGVELVDIKHGRRRRHVQRPGHDEGLERLRRHRGHERHAQRRRRPRLPLVERRPRRRLMARRSTS